MSKHTPGRWETGSTITRVEVLPEGWRMPMCIADCHAKHSPESEAERCANARLIAAAPQLYQDLKEMVSLAQAICDGWTTSALAEAVNQLHDYAVNYASETLDQVEINE